MKKYTWHHYSWFAALAIMVLLFIANYTYWYAPVLVYFAVEILGIFVLALIKGKVSKLPEYSKEAAKKAWRR